MNPKVSIIIRTYNRADLIERAIQSALEQSFQDFEIIVADDGSTDHTKELVEQLTLKDHRIRFVTQDHSGRPGRTLNLGLQNSRGRYIAMLDSDDEWLPSKLEKQIKLLESSAPNIGLVFCHTIAINQDGAPEKRPVSHAANFLEAILLKGYLFPSSMLAKKEVFGVIGPIDENFLIMDDWDMFIRMAQECQYNFVSEPLYKYYIHHTNISFSKNYAKHAADLEYLLNKHSALYKSHPKILEHHYITLASYLINADEMKKAKFYLKKSFQLNRSLKNLLRLALSYFGKIVYQKYRTSRGRLA